MKLIGIELELVMLSVLPKELRSLLLVYTNYSSIQLYIDRFAYFSCSGRLVIGDKTMPLYLTRKKLEYMLTSIEKNNAYDFVEGEEACSFDILPNDTHSLLDSIYFDYNDKKFSLNKLKIKLMINNDTQWVETVIELESTLDEVQSQILLHKLNLAAKDFNQSGVKVY